MPPYSYVPGMFPHPVSDPAGHMHGEEVMLDANEAFAFGFDLFNHGYYWEAHEAWEQAWIAVGREGEVADLLKGLIKLAAAGVKAREGKPSGVRRHALRAEELFRERATCEQHCGQWAEHVHAVAENASDLVDSRDSKVVVIFDFQLAMPELPPGSFVDKNS